MDCIKNMDIKISILTVETALLRPNPWNTNVVGARNFDKLKNSIDRLGFFKPIWFANCWMVLTKSSAGAPVACCH
jgi:hypothetical protein